MWPEKSDFVAQHYVVKERRSRRPKSRQNVKKINGEELCVFTPPTPK